MRTLRYLGVALLVAGGLLVLAPTGAFDASDADRGLAVEAAGDATAALGIDYASPDRVIRLESPDGCLLCFHTGEELALLEDNTAAGELTVTDFEFAESGDLTFFRGVTNVSDPNGIEAIIGDFDCPTTGFPDFEQGDARTTVTMDITVSDGDVTISVTRSVVVECVETGSE